MAGLFLVRDDDARFAADSIAGARQIFNDQGFPAPAEHRLNGWRLLHFAHIIDGPDGLLVDGDDLVAVAGMPVVDGKIGQAGLAALLAMDPLKLDWNRIGGQFVAVARRGGRSFVFGDYFAAFQLFVETQGRVASTSLLGAAAALPGLRFDPQGVYELAFNVMPLGDDTIFAELKTLSPFQVVELTGGGIVRHAMAKPLPTQCAKLPLSERVERHRAALSNIVEAHTAHFGDNLRCPLSGGLDSRLVLAALRERGSRPEVYVYGHRGDPDVEIAKAIGSTCQFDIAWTDKDETQIEPDAFAELVNRNYHQFDGLPTFGNIFDNGGHGAAQIARHAGGALTASGGCGEIYRNFFYLPDRSFSANDIAETFFARFIDADAVAGFDSREFLDRIAGKIAEAIGAPRADRPIARTWIEQVYPRIRCRALFGREISLEARFSPYLMPFLDHHVVGEAMTLPLSLKNAGRFEAALLNAIDPQLARQPSAYGHDFTGPPGLRHRFGEWHTRARPVWLRRHSYALRRRMTRMADEHGGLLTPEYMNRVIDPEFPAMRRFFNIDAITDSGLWRRIANLEYLAQRLGSKLT